MPIYYMLDGKRSTGWKQKMNTETIIAQEKQKIEDLAYLISIGKEETINTDLLYRYCSSFDFSELDEIEWVEDNSSWGSYPRSRNDYQGTKLMKVWAEKVIRPLESYWYKHGKTDDERYCLDELYSVAMCERNQL